MKKTRVIDVEEAEWCIAKIGDCLAHITTDGRGTRKVAYFRNEFVVHENILNRITECLRGNSSAITSKEKKA